MDLDAYLNSVVAAYPRGDLRDRRFRLPEKWGEWSNQHYRSTPLLDADPTLEAVLAERFAIVLGEPGSGKSSVVHLAVERAIQKQWTPVVGILKGFDGDLAKVFAIQPPAGDGQRLYILDGLDEVPEERLADAVKAIKGLIDAEPSNRVLLTSRQAFYATRAELFRGREPAAYHLLDLTSEDIDAIVDRAGVNRVAFLQTAELGRVYSELHNPFALTSLLKLFKDTGKLTSSRSGAVHHVVYQLLSERPTKDERNQARALRVLAVAMEAAARNQLTQPEAVKTLVTAIDISDEEAARLVDELTSSILVKTNDGYSFQMASYGEYLAAEDLSAIRELPRFLPLMRLHDGQVLSDSWQNTASYLAELHRGFRTWLVRNKPEWAINASPSSFSDIEKTRVVRAIIGELTAKQLYLNTHPTIRADRLALFVTDASRTELRAQLTRDEAVAWANALLLLGAAKDKEVVDKALALALDEKRDLHSRRSALSALEYVGQPAMVPVLLQITDWTDDLASARLDAAGSVVEPNQIQILLEALSKTDTMISGAHQRFAQFESDEAVVATIDAVEALGSERLGFRMSSYIEPIWRLMIRRWKPEWANRLARIVLGHGHEHEYDSAMEELIKLLASTPTVGAAVGTAIVDELRTNPRPVTKFNHHALRLISEADAKRALEIGDKDLIRNIRAFGSPAAQVFLHNQNPVEYVPSPEEVKWKKEDQKRKAFVVKQQGIALDHSVEPKERLNALWRIHNTDNWPPMSVDQAKPLAVKVEEELYALNLRTSIEWISETQWRRPQSLSFFLEVIEKYGIRLADDQVLALAIMASQQHEVGKYFDKHGFSAKAIDTLEQLLRDATVADGAKDSLLRFIANKALSKPTLIDAIEQLATTATSNTVKGAAVSALIRMAETVPALTRVRNHVSPAQVEEIDLALVEKADRPTIERRLSELLDHPERLEQGETEHPWDNKLSWLGKISSADYWEKLKRIRRQALRDKRGRVSSILTQVLVNIDPMRAVAVIQEQFVDTPAEWLPFVRARAIEIRRDATIKVAQNTPFDEILARLRRATTIGLFKLACEGPKDIPAFEALTLKLPNDVGQDIQVESLGGWGNVQAPEWNPMVLVNGSHDQMAILDGDWARDWTHPTKRLKTEARRVLAKFRRAGIDCRVLQRYAVENYFSKEAFIAVIGQHVEQHFPLDPDRPVRDQIPGYTKDMNGKLAEATTLADLAGTDLGDALTEIADRATL